MGGDDSQGYDGDDGRDDRDDEACLWIEWENRCSTSCGFRCKYLVPENWVTGALAYVCSFHGMYFVSEFGIIGTCFSERATIGKCIVSEGSFTDTYLLSEYTTFSERTTFSKYFVSDYATAGTCFISERTTICARLSPSMPLSARFCLRVPFHRHVFRL